MDILKWKDLETEKLYKCKLNGTEYEVRLFEPVWTGTADWRVRLISGQSWIYIDQKNKQFFDDLHLELISIK